MISQETVAEWTADFVIVGGGTAGAVIARRLSDNPQVRVLLVEAGGTLRSLISQMPAGYAKMVANPQFDWLYETVPDPTQDGRAWIWTAGKMLGGSSSLNGQVFIRGTRADFDQWAALGAAGWGFDDVWPYFLKSECWTGKPNQAHGMTGPLSVSPMRDPHPLCSVFLDGCAQAGIPTLHEYNDGSSFGAFLVQTNQRRGWRCSTEKAFLRPVRQRTNLVVVTEAEVERITIEQGRAVGVELRRAGTLLHAKATREVIVCAGALGTPALLMRSGIGPAEYLRKAGIEPWIDSPGVGENLQEHSCVAMSKFVTSPTLNVQMTPLAMTRHILNFISRRKGPLSAPATQALALVRTIADLDEPDVQLHFSPLAYSIRSEARTPIGSPMADRPAVTIAASLCKPRGRGRVGLASDGRPSIAHNLLGNDEDIDTLIRGLKLIDQIFSTEAFRAIDATDRAPAPVPMDRDSWVDHLRRNTMLTWHPVGTCRMGTDEAAVVDPELRVRGIRGLRVADASVMPTITSCNTAAPVIMIGERAAALICSA